MGRVMDRFRIKLNCSYFDSIVIIDKLNNILRLEESATQGSKLYIRLNSYYSGFWISTGGNILEYYNSPAVSKASIGCLLISSI